MLSASLPTVLRAQLLLFAHRNVLARRALGDVEGHEFHGNQWTGGGGGQSPSPMLFHTDSGFRTPADVARLEKTREALTREGERLQREFPALAQSQVEELHLTNGHVGDHSDQYSGGRMTLSVSAVATSVPDKFGGGQHANVSVRGAFLHEYGHHVDFNGVLGPKAKEEWGKTYTQELGEKISGYAGQSASEGFAEAFSVYTHSGYGKGSARLPAPIKAYFEKHLPRTSIRHAGDVAGHEFHGNQYTTSYHGTTEDRESKIVKEGLRGDKAGTHSAISATGTVSTSSSLERAWQYAQDRAELTRKAPVVVEVRVPTSQKSSAVKGFGGHTIHTYYKVHPRHIVKVHKLRGAAFRTAGDLPGHEFHGNQWTSGGGSEQAKGERDRQAQLAAAQVNPLAHPEHDIVLGLNREGKGTLNYVAAYGQEHTPQPLPSQYERGQAKECYKNASLLVLNHPELTYAEGFAKSDKTGDLTFMHAWAVDKNNRVVDPTWDRPENGKYFGVKYERAAYLKYLYTAKIYGVLGSTHNNARKAIDTGMPKMRALEWNEDLHPRDERGRFGPGGGSMLDKPVSHFAPMHAEGRDTREQFSDGHGHYTPERAALHEAIIEKYMAGTTPVEKPVAMVLGGGMGAGKTTLVNAEGLNKGNTVDVNVDKIRSDLPEVKGMIERGEKMNVALAHEEASDIGKELMTRALKDSRNMTLDGTGDTTLEKLGGKAALMRASGHEVVAEYVTLPTKMAQERADRRAETTDLRFVPPSAMKAVHEEVSRIFPEAVRQGLFDRARLWDTRGERGVRPKLVMSAKGRDITVHDKGLWEEFLVKGHLGH